MSLWLPSFSLSERASWCLCITGISLRHRTVSASTQRCAPTHAHTHTQPFYGSMDFVWDNPGEITPEEKFTHLHLSWTSIVPYLLLPCNTIHGILPVQSMHLTVFFHNVCPSFLWSTSWPSTLHFILHASKQSLLP